MATKYSHERIEAMTAEVLAAAEALGVPFLAPHPQRPGREPVGLTTADDGYPTDDHGPTAGDLSVTDGEDAAAAQDLVTALLEASAEWGTTTGCRAVGPFGTFLAGMVSGPECCGLAAVSDLVHALERDDHPAAVSSGPETLHRRAG
ncbi:hypothetical protein [Brevibacterium metallidurans]|uniref:Uncharacterized protein n=1 Tax=Brevibacterium metallidurans TaxID=1482676 RepID=A0ABN0SIE2_9MICO